MNKKFSVQDFLKRYPNDDVCMDELFKLRYGDMPCCPSCKTVLAKFYRVSKRRSYECGTCGHQLYPTAGTVMHGSRTPLRLWFYAIFLFTKSRNGVSAMELQRHLGVTYKCAWRIGHKIRELMSGAEEDMFSGVVEADEMLFGGAVRGGRRGWGAENKVSLFGLIERGGRVKVTMIADRDRANIMPLIEKYVMKGTVVNTDDFKAYAILDKLGYEHHTVTHSKYQWAQGEKYTNSMEGYWSNLHKFIFGTHTFISRRHFPKYLAEFEFRHNRRDRPEEMFGDILKLM
jgi:transposase-like protein